MQSLCNEYGININIPLAYIEYIHKKGHFYLGIPCGLGKTIGLAIAAACDDDLRFNYVASTHSRLSEFVDTLAYLGVDFHYMRSSNESLTGTPDFQILKSSRIIILTSSMLLQFDYSIIGGLMCNRALIIDELPKILLPVYYDTRSYEMMKGLDGRFNRINYLDVHKCLLDEDLYFGFDSALNNNEPYTVPKRKKIFFARYEIIHKFLKKNPPKPKVFAEGDKFEYDIFYLTMLDLYLSKSNTSIILDATADLYHEVIQSEEIMIDGVTKDYADYIDQVRYGSIGERFAQRDFILSHTESIISEIIPELQQFPGPYYLVTHNSGVYDGMGESKIVNDGFTSFMEGMFKQTYVNDNKDFILCRSTDNKIESDKNGKVITENTDLFISNFARSRGSNFFRNCRTVCLLGSFFLPEKELKTMLTQNHFEVKASDLQTNLAIADAVQEISRGCIRKRDKNNRMNLIMIGDKNVINGVFNYMNIHDAIEMSK